MKKWIALSALFMIIMNLNAQNVIEKTIGDTLKIKIKNCGNNINTIFPEYAPVITADKSLLFFTTRRSQTKSEIKKNKFGHEQVASSLFNETANKWESAAPVVYPVNVMGYNSSAIAISNDGYRLLMYRDAENGNGDIYESELKGIEWTEPVKLPEPLNSSYHESSASYSPDGRTIYFVSDRPNGVGGRDIWYCTKDLNGVWGMAKNIGNIVNSDQDEEAVFMHPDGKTLYFSSKRNGGLGSYDIYQTRFEKIQWSTPINLGEPLNTTGDDVFYVLSADGKYAYYASAREGTLGETDIFEITYTTLEKKINKGPQLALLKGVISDEITGKAIEAVIEVVDNDKNEEISLSSSNSATGKYLIALPAGKNYGITVTAPGYLFYSENINIPDTAVYKEITLNIIPKRIEKGSKIVLNNIFFEYGKSDLLPASQQELNRLIKVMNDNIAIVIEISGHTDNLGSVAFNQKLSEARAKAVVDYLILKDIPMSRMLHKGYGFTQPVSTNDTEEGRALNRRTEFKIVSK